MTVRLKPVTRDDLGPLFRLKVTDDQTLFVAPNEKTLAQVAYEPSAEVYGIWSEKTLVGLVAWINFDGYPHLEDGDDPKGGFVWRLLIGADHQARGFGRAAMNALHERARLEGVRTMYITAVPENSVGIGLYKKLGYVETGRVIDGEVELALKF